MSMPISHPWLARRRPVSARRVGGQRIREQLSPSWGLRGWSDVRESRRGPATELSRRWLLVNRLRTLNSRGGLCRACVRGGGATTVMQQPGRERPPLPPPGPGPEGVLTGVAHAPAACPVCPDKVVRARTIQKTHREFRNRQSDGNAKHVETVAAVVHVFLNRRVPCH
jgi:hypothetical protein